MEENKLSNSIKVINRAENNLEVTVTNVYDNIQIIINKKIDTNLLSLNAGNIFKANGVEYMVLEHLDKNQTAIIKKVCLEDTMEFDSDNNNWKTSGIRKKLNGYYLKELEETFGKGKIVEHTVNLLSMDGLDNYGMSTDKVSLLTIDQYRKYRKVLGENMNIWWWLITPDSTPLGESASYVRFVGSDGRMRCCMCDLDMGVRPFFVLQS